MDASEAITWAEDHPLATAGIVFVGGLAILWMLGYIGGGTSTASPNNSALDAAYYNAEAAQTTSGNQLQMAQAGYAAQTAIAGIQTTGSVDIAQLAYGAAGQSYATQAAIAASQYGSATQIAAYQAQAQEYAVTGAENVADTQSNNSLTAYQDLQQSNVVQAILPYEFAQDAATGGRGIIMTIAGQGETPYGIDINAASYPSPVNTPVSTPTPTPTQAKTTTPAAVSAPAPGNSSSYSLIDTNIPGQSSINIGGQEYGGGEWGSSLIGLETIDQNGNVTMGMPSISYNLNPQAGGADGAR